MATAAPDSSLKLPSIAPSGSPTAEFVQEFTRAQRPLYLYILSLVPRPTDAEEILQETNLVIWRKSEQFQSGTSFLAWSQQIAYFEVLKYRERARREKLQFSDELIQVLAVSAEEQAEMLDNRREALAHCLSKLKDGDRELLEKRYAPGVTGEDVAGLLNRPVNSVYQSLGRIRRALFDCISRRLAPEARQ